MSDAALQAMTEAAILDMDVMGSIVDKMAARLGGPLVGDDPAPADLRTGRLSAHALISQADFLAIQETVARTAAAIRAQPANRGES